MLKSVQLLKYCYEFEEHLMTKGNISLIPKYQDKSKQSLFSIHVSANLYPITVSLPTLPEPKSKSEKLLY